MKPVDQLLEARWVIPVEPHGIVLDHHTVVVAGDTIADVLPIESAREKYPNARRVDLSTHALIPGLVNTHTHNPMVLMRGLADDLPLMTWLNEHIWPAEGRVMGPEFVRDGIELAIAEMLRGGTTCCNENYLFPDAQAATYIKHGFRAVIGLPFIEFPTAWAKSRDEYFDKNLAVHDALRDEVLVTTTLAPHAPYTVSNEAFERIRLMSDQLDLPVHLHLHETAQEVEDGKRDHGMRPIARMQALGLVNDHLIAIHMTQLIDSEIALMAEAGASVVHCPESNLKLASGFCPAEKLRRAGVNLAIGTDGAASNNDIDMFGETRTAAMLAKAVANDASAFDAAFALQAATLNGARAVGLADRIGSIVAGKQADLVAVRLDAIETQPIYHVASQLVYATGRHQVSDVWIAGQRKLDDRQLVGIDLDALRGKAREWHERIAFAQ
ncbi:MAG: TRZ/ATZ family hydrolase [Rudaea sp.]|uniref:TRZ/ATZ family hydrolase n=1 Tax=unclassified Rudaea TaxID=2627037 RepID=UPI0010F4D9D0|nr:MULTISPECIES: TRZ/ATZ family hydrolase [unclassified Rudaea]MBN8888606.1 TRZ/ATZ family hydrolase [Rudaea sp.]MBR0347845.1 TRZ/ATZ family hydrolase [Rudaea sp.]